MDCEMVGVGSMGATSVLARVSIVNYHGKVILDEYVLPQEQVIDYRTAVSGITPKLLRERGKPFKEIQQKVSDILKNKIIVGHGLKNDLDVLMLDHPRKLLRDTARYKPLRNPKTKLPRSLKNLAKDFLKKEIQSGEHSSTEDARIALEIYQLHKHEWEQTMYRQKEISLKPQSW
jgi:RNA exonuclease 4